MATELVFRTPAGGANIPVKKVTNLGNVIVDRYRQIRVVADERRGSANDVDVRLTITEGDDLVAQLDVLALTPGLEVTKVYDVPGIKLTVFAESATGKDATSSTVDVLIYGFWMY